MEIPVINGNSSSSSRNNGSINSSRNSSYDFFKGNGGKNDSNEMFSSVKSASSTGR